MKRIVAFLLCLCLIVGMVPMAFAADAGLDNFTPAAVYTPGQFTDVAAGAWYEGNIITAYELGLVKGKTASTFEPNGNITVGEVITLAARIHSIYNTGEANFVQGAPWYQVYVDYALANGIIAPGAFSDFKAAATRSQCALILSKAVPASELKAINSIEDIPDVSMGAGAWATAVYTLYNAGVLTGNDKYGTFAPTSNIKRSEIATIVTRIVTPSLRKAFSLEVQMVTLYSPDKRVMSVKASEANWYVEHDQWSKTPVDLKIEAGGTYSSYDGVFFWEYGEGFLNIGGRGETPYYNNAEWKGHKYTTHTLYLERGIEKIASFQFDDWSGLSHVEIPDTVTWIDSYAFTDTNLESISIPSSVTYISYSAFDKGDSIMVYCEKGSYAESWAKDMGYAVVYASPVYYPDGRSCMVLAPERELYLANGWYRFPVTTLYAGAKTTVIAESLVQDYIAVGWQDEVCQQADAAITKGGFNAGVEFMEDVIDNMSASDTMYSAYQAKMTKILGNWRATLGDPIAITDCYISYNSINVPEVNITFRNISTKTVTNLEAFWTCIDAYGNVTADWSHLNGNYNGWMDGIWLEPGESETFYWTMYSNERTASVKNLRMEKCAFADGTSWYYTSWYY